MEAFSLLKYWRGGGGGGGNGGVGGPAVPAGGGDTVGVGVKRAATTIVTALAQNGVETDDDNDNDDGPFFDLEFTVPDEEEEGEDCNSSNGNGDEKQSKKEGNNAAAAECDCGNEVVESSDSDSDDGEREFNFTLSSGSSSSNHDRTDPNLSLSPSDDLFFKGRLVPIESSSPLDSTKNQFPVASLLKSATKFRVFMMGLKKSKMHATAANEKTETPPSPASSTKDSQQKQESLESKEESDTGNKQSNKFFTVKFKVEEVPIVSLFTRENSKSIKTTSSLSQKPSSNQASEESAYATASDEKQRFSKDVMQKYLKKVKPLYIRVSKRYGDKLKFSGQLRLRTSVSPPSTEVAEQKPTSPPATKSGPAEADGKEPTTPAATAVHNAAPKSQKQGSNMPAGLRVVCKHLGKSRSASSAAVAAVPTASGPISSRRRDDSLLQQQDGIQSAILHCKRSFNASRDSESSSSSSVLSRSVSDPSHEK